jgi:flagellar hook-associated protein 2
MSTPSVDLINSVLDVGAIVDSLIYVESAPVRSMQSQVSTLQSKISAFQSLNTKLSTFTDSVNTLLFGDTEAPFVKPFSYSERLSDSIFSKGSVTSSDSDLISATASSGATSGSYSIAVSGLAQAQSSASSNYADATAALLGTGTLIITTGGNDPVTINITDSNNTLNGARDAINNANAGVTATVINDGSANPYRLLITSNESGTGNSFTVADSLSGGQALGMTEVQAATDAQFSVNGVSITKNSNTVSDVISGVTFTLKAETTGPVTLTVDKDIDAIVEGFNEFVAAYNEINTYINSQFTYNTTLEKAGLLAGDPTLRRIQSNLQNSIIQSAPNQFTNYSVASQVGLEFNRDGSLSLNEAEFRDALSSNFTAVAALFLGDGIPAGTVQASDSRVTYNGKTEATQTGTYSILVHTLAEQATAVGTQQVVQLDGRERLTITAGSSSAVVDLQNNDTLAEVLLKINTELSAQGMAITASDDGTGRIQIKADNFGSAHSFTVVSDGDGSAGTTGFGSTPAAADGVDIAGTIGGHAAIGSGLTLTGAAGQPEEGLSLTIAQTTAGDYGSIAFTSDSEGIEGASILMNLQSLLDGITDPLSGPIHNSTDSLNKNIRSLNDQIEAYEDRLESRRIMLTAEFQKADEALRLLSVTQSSLSSQIGSLSSQ